MKERTKRGTQLRRMIVVLALGVAIGTMIVATPASAHFRSSIDHIWSHIKPKADARYVNETQVKTLRGVYYAEFTGDAGAIGSDSISFGLTLPSAPTPHFIKSGDAAPAECPGTVALPRAAAGHLCVFEATASNASSSRGVWSPEGGEAATRMGTGVYVYSAAAGQFWSRGTWAVTSGSGTSSASAKQSSSGSTRAGG